MLWVYLCSCSCCSKLRGVSFERKGWQLAGLLAKTLALWAEERSGLMIVVHDSCHGNCLQTNHVGIKKKAFVSQIVPVAYE